MNFHGILRMTQKELFDYLYRRFPWAVIAEDEYIYAPGNIPLMLVAHMDTVHREPVQTICTSAGGKIVMSPQGIGGDDRCGVWGLLQCYGTDLHPHLLFTCDEEVGGLGADAFAQDWIATEEMQAPLKYIVELDRKGAKDAVYYDCYCPELEDYITGFGYKTEWGTFSDISVLSPAMRVPSVNLSCGYYNAHTQHEYINLVELYKTIHKVQQMIAEIDAVPFFEYGSFMPADNYSLYEYDRKQWYLTEEEEEEWIQYYKQQYGAEWTPKWLK